MTTTTIECFTCGKPLAGRGKCKSSAHEAIGPRKVGTIIKTIYGTEVVLAIEENLGDWMDWAITVKDLDGATPGRIRRHCTPWKGDRWTVVVSQPDAIAIA